MYKNLKKISQRIHLIIKSMDEPNIVDFIDSVTEEAIAKNLKCLNLKPATCNEITPTTICNIFQHYIVTNVKFT